MTFVNLGAPGSLVNLGASPYGYFAPLGAPVIGSVQGMLRLGVAGAAAVAAFMFAPAIIPRGVPGSAETALAVAAGIGGWFAGQMAYDAAYKGATGISVTTATDAGKKIVSSIPSFNF